MEKIKSFKFSSFLNIIKCSLLAILITLIGIVVLAVILKFVDLNSTTIHYINDVIKAIAIFIMVLSVKRNSEDKLLIKSVVAGIIYAVLCFIIFSILNGSFMLNLGFIYDLLFSIIVAVIASIILNILKRKTI